MLLVLVAVLGVTMRDLITRSIPDNVASTVISFQAFASLIFAGSILMFMKSDHFVSLSDTEIAYFGGGIIFGVIGYYGIVAAMRVGDAAVVTPFRYTRLLFSIIIGVLVFNERPDLFTMLGAGIVLGTGIYTFLRERRTLSK